MLLLHFLEQEHEWIADLDDKPESWREWWEHYQTLSPKEQAVAQYMLTAARKAGDAEEYLGLDCGPIRCVDQKNVNNGFGIMYSIDRGCFLRKETKLFYVRSDMWIPPDRDPAIVPEWISDLAEGCKKYSSGLKKVRPEVIQYTFDGQPPCGYYAITFLLDKKRIRKSIRMEDARWWPERTTPYLLTIMDITGEYDYAIGELTSSGPVVLWRDSIDFD